MSTLKFVRLEGNNDRLDYWVKLMLFEYIPIVIYNCQI